MDHVQSPQRSFESGGPFFPQLSLDLTVDERKFNEMFWKLCDFIHDLHVPHAKAFNSSEEWQ